MTTYHLPFSRAAAKRWERQAARRNYPFGHLNYVAAIDGIEKRWERDTAILAIIPGTNSATLQIQARAGHRQLSIGGQPSPLGNVIRGPRQPVSNEASTPIAPWQPTRKPEPYVEPAKRWAEDEEFPAPWPTPVPSEQTPADTHRYIYGLVPTRKARRAGDKKVYLGNDVRIGTGAIRVMERKGVIDNTRLPRLSRSAEPLKVSGAFGLPSMDLPPEWRNPLPGTPIFALVTIPRRRVIPVGLYEALDGAGRLKHRNVAVTTTPRRAKVVPFDDPVAATRCRNDKGAYPAYDPAAKGSKRRAATERPVTDAQRAAVAKVFTPERAAELVEMQDKGRFVGLLRKKGWNDQTAKEDGNNAVSMVIEAVSKGGYEDQGKFDSFSLKIVERRGAEEVDRRVKMPPMQQYSPLMDDLGVRAEKDDMPVEITGASWAAVQDSPDDAAPGGKSKGGRFKPLPDWTLHDWLTTPKDVTAEDLCLSPGQRKRKWDGIHNWERFCFSATPKQLDTVFAMLSEVERHYVEHKLSKLQRADGQDAFVKSETQYEREHIALKRAALKAAE